MTDYFTPDGGKAHPMPGFTDGVKFVSEPPPTVEEIHRAIVTSEIFRLDGHKIDLCSRLVQLCEAVRDEEETNWDIGSDSGPSLGDVIEGAWWSLCEWHAGQHSEGYAALSMLGSLYQPGPAMRGPERNSGAADVFAALENYFTTRNPS